MHKTHIVIGALAALVLNASWATADGVEDQPTESKVDEARELYSKGMELAQKGDCKSAVGAFQESMGIMPNKGSLYNLAICYNKLGKYQKAMGAPLQLVREFDAELRDDMKQSAKAEMKALKDKFAWVNINATQKGAEVLVDGKKQGEIPLDAALPVEKKAQTIVVALKGYRPWAKTVDLSQGGEVSYDVTLEPEDGQLSLSVAIDGATVMVDGKMVGVTPLPASIALNPGDHKVVVAEQTIESIERMVTVEAGEQFELVIDQNAIVMKTTDEEGTVTASDLSPKQRLFRVGGFAGIGVGAAGLIAGIATGALALGMDKDLAKKCPDGECPDEVDYVSDEQKMNNLGAASTAMLTAGGVLAVAGATLLVLSYKLDFKEKEQVSVLPSLDPNMFGASLSCRF